MLLPEAHPAITPKGEERKKEGEERQFGSEGEREREQMRKREGEGGERETFPAKSIHFR